ncbi:MAG: lysophospholipid acyltransferase family protein [Sphingobacteriales bacterium]
MKLILKKAHVYSYRFSVAFFYILCYPYLYFLALDPKRYPTIVKMRRRIAKISSGMVGIRYRFAYEQPIDWSKAFIVCPNHSSNLDISAMCALIKGNCSFMGKEELSDEPVTSLFFRTIDVAVNRDSKMSSYRAFKKAMEKLADGTTMIIFPEGKIGEDYPPQLEPFKNGPFRLAIESNIPMVPVTMRNSWELLWDNGLRYGSRPGICDIFVHKPIETAGMSIEDTDALRDRVYDTIKQKLAEK